MAAFKPASQMTEQQKAALVTMHYGKRVSYDLFDFPGTGAHLLDDMAHKFGVVVGNHRNGFSITKRGAAWAAKQTHS